MGNKSKAVLILSFIILSLFSVSFKSSEKTIPKFTYPLSTSHPRLLLDRDTEYKIDSICSINPNIAAVDKEIIKFADWIIAQPTLEYKLTGIRLLDISRSALKRIFCLSYAYRKTHNEKYAERAVEEISAVCEFPDWNPSHYLDVAEMAIGVAIGYDWLYEDIASTKKDLIIQAIKDKAIAPSFKSGYNRYKRLNNNWNAVCNAGMLYTAITFYEEFPEFADSIIHDCLTTNPKAIKQYNPDGGCPEGYCYWDYGTSFQVLIIDALERNYGSDFGLTNSTGFLNTGQFIQFMESPSSLCFNFSDSPQKASINIPLFWFAERTNNPSLLYTISKYLANPKELKEVCKSRLLPLLPIYASRLKFSNLSKPQNNFWFSDGATPVFIYRSDWDDTTDSYLGVKGGSPSTPHAHMDAGSFVYEFDGIRWASDLGMPNYNFIESRGIKLWDTSQGGDRWNILRMRNDHHNTLTIDNDRHNVDGNALIIHLFKSDGRKGCLIDLSQTLTKIRKAHREVSLDENDYLAVIDSIETGDESIQLHWNMITSAEARILNDTTILLKKDNKQMALTVNSQSKILPYVCPVVPLHDYDEPINGLSRVGITQILPAQTHSVLSVQMHPLDKH